MIPTKSGHSSDIPRERLRKKSVKFNDQRKLYIIREILWLKIRYLKWYTKRVSIAIERNGWLSYSGNRNVRCRYDLVIYMIDYGASGMAASAFFSLWSGPMKSRCGTLDSNVNVQTSLIAGKFFIINYQAIAVKWIVAMGNSKGMVKRLMTEQSATKYLTEMRYVFIDYRKLYIYREIYRLKIR